MIQTFPRRVCTPAAPAVCCGVAAFGRTEATVAEMAGLRQRLAAAWAGTLSAPVVRQADEQTIVGLAAVAQARNQPGLAGVEFSDWGVLAAPRYFGRAALAASLERTRIDGPWGVSPHFVPHRSLHSLPGLLSLGLRAHGPNLGVGGGPDAESEVMLTAAIFLHAERLPGVWVVFTAWQPEPAPTKEGQLSPDAVCRAVALALLPSPPLRGRGVGGEGAGIHLRITCRRAASSCCPPQGGFTLEALHAALRRVPDYPTTWVWRLEQGLIELCWSGITEESHP